MPKIRFLDPSSYIIFTSISLGKKLDVHRCCPAIPSPSPSDASPVAQGSSCALCSWLLCASTTCKVAANVALGRLLPLPSWGLLGPVGDGDMDLKILLPVTFSAILYSRLNHFQCDQHLIKNYCSRIYPLRLFFVECTFLCTLQGYFHCEPLSISLSISQVKGLHPEDMAPTERAPACLVNAYSKHHAIDTTARIGKLCDGTGKRQCHA